jgi:membrane-associated phospholipid phosphatase
MLFLTDFADQAVVLPLALMVAVAFTTAGWRRGAVAWVVAVGATLIAVLLGKMAVDAWGDAVVVATGLRSPSGHTASAAVAYGGLIALLAPRKWRPCWSALVAACLFAVLFGASRIATHMHSEADVVTGAVIGIAGALLLAQLAGERPPNMHRLLPLAVAVGVVVLCHGEHLRGEEGIQCLSHLTFPLSRCVPPY